jgi:MtN3 and saliva related transmembrane protein
MSLTKAVGIQRKYFRKYFQNFQKCGDNMLEISIIGLVAGLLTTGSQVPQAYKVYKTKSTSDLSALWISILFIGTMVWLYYGLMINDLPLIIWNTISIFTLGYIASYKFAIIKTKTDNTHRETRSKTMETQQI